MNITEPKFNAKSKQYEWNGLTVKQSKHGLGVFTTKALKKFTCIPILGKVIDKGTEAQNNHSHFWKIQGHGLRGTRIDGHPSVNNNNLNIAMMLNEPHKGSPNCIFWRDMIVIIKPLKADIELFCWYGKMYPRGAFGYKLLKSVTKASQSLSDKLLNSKSFEIFDNRLKTNKNKKILADLFQKHLKETEVVHKEPVIYKRNDTDLPKKYLKDVLAILKYDHDRHAWLVDVQDLIRNNAFA
jgi:hypothetical protein